MANIQDSGKMIVMELAKGGELGEYLEKTGKMTEEKAKGRKIPGAFCMEECLIILDAWFENGLASIDDEIPFLP